MHIPENYLSPVSCGVLTAAMVPVWVHAIKNVKRDIPKSKMPLLGIGAAFSFIGMMFNIPLPGGTTGHAVGGTLIAAILGPDAACLSMSIALILQALLFGDGGILAIGANCFNMAFVLPYLGFFIYKLISKRIQGDKGKLIGVAIGSYVGINAAALCAAIEFGIQPMLFTDAAGQALYCPYGLNIAIPAMMIGHLTIFGLAEVIFTTAVLAFVLKVSPGLVVGSESTKRSSKPLFGLLAVLIAAVPLGLLATGTAWGEWDPADLASMITNGTALGYTPSGMENGFSFEAMIPDYALGGVPEVAGYILSAVIGIAIVVIFFKIIASFMKNKTDYQKA